MNRLSEYITGMTLTRQLIREAKIFIGKDMPKSSEGRALWHLIYAFDAFVAATNCAISIREKKKPK